MAHVELQMSSLIPLWIMHMWHSRVDKNGLQSLNVSPLQGPKSNPTSSSKAQTSYQVGCQQICLWVGCLQRMPKAGLTTFMECSGFDISMHEHASAFKILTNTASFFATVTTVIFRPPLSATAFKIVLNSFYCHLTHLTFYNHWMSEFLHL